MELRDINNQKLRTSDSIKKEFDGEVREGHLIARKYRGMKYSVIEIIPSACNVDLGLGKGCKIRLTSPDELKQWKLSYRIHPVDERIEPIFVPKEQQK